MQIEVQLGGQVRTLRFGNYALMTYNKLTQTEAGTVKEFSDEYGNMDLVCDITFSGLKAFYKIKKQTFDITYEQVMEWVDEMQVSQIQEIINAFSESVSTSEIVQKAIDAMASESQETEVKKK